MYIKNCLHARHRSHRLIESSFLSLTHQSRPISTHYTMTIFDMLYYAFFTTYYYDMLYYAFFTTYYYDMLYYDIWHFFQHTITFFDILYYDFSIFYTDFFDILYCDFITFFDILYYDYFWHTVRWLFFFQHTIGPTITMPLSTYYTMTLITFVSTYYDYFITFFDILY